MTKNITIFISVGLTLMAMATVVALNWIALPQATVPAISASTENQALVAPAGPNWVEVQAQIQQNETAYQQQRAQLESALTQRDADYAARLSKAQAQIQTAETNLATLEQARLEAEIRINTLQQTIQTGDDQYQSQINTLVDQLQAEETQIQAEIAQTLSQLEAARAELSTQLAPPPTRQNQDYQGEDSHEYENDEHEEEDDDGDD